MGTLGLTEVPCKGSVGDLGPLLGAFVGDLGPLLGPMLAVWGRSWGLCWRSWAALGGLWCRSWAVLGAFVGDLGPSWGPLLAVLDGFCATLFPFFFSSCAWCWCWVRCSSPRILATKCLSDWHPKRLYTSTRALLGAGVPPHVRRYSYNFFIHRYIGTSSCAERVPWP